MFRQLDIGKISLMKGSCLKIRGLASNLYHVFTPVIIGLLLNRDGEYFDESTTIFIALTFIIFCGQACRNSPAPPPRSLGVLFFMIS